MVEEYRVEQRLVAAGEAGGMSARERRPGTTGSSNRPPSQSPSLSLLSKSSSRPATSSARSNQTREAKFSCRKSHSELNDPLVVNKTYCHEDFRSNGHRYPPMLKPNHDRFPTVPREKLDLKKSNRPLSCPKEFIDRNLNPSWEENPQYIPHVGLDLKASASQHFIENNFEYMSEFRPEYRNKSPRSLRNEIVNSAAFCSTMRELKRKEHSVKNGTSSYYVRKSLSYKGNESDNNETIDPFIMTKNTSRESRQDKMNKLLLPHTREMSLSKTFNRGYQHDPEFKNFSAFNGHLLKNKGSMLER